MSNNKFAQNLTLSSTSIKETRAKLISEDAQAAHEELLRKLQQDLRDLARKKDALSDLYPESELSLMIAKPNFDAKKWVADLQNLGVAMANKTVEIKIAQDTYNEWFAEDNTTPVVTPPVANA